MVLPVIAFYIFSVLALVSSFLVITVRNPVHSVLFLILAFFNSAALFVLLGAEFLAMILVVVYVGAVAVLFLFVVMMLDTNFVSLKGGLKQNISIGLFVGLLLLCELIGISSGFFNNSEQKIFSLSTDNTKELGLVIYTKYAYIFELSGLVLFVAMIGAIVLTMRGRSGSKRQTISNQVSRLRKDSVELIKVKSGDGI